MQGDPASPIIFKIVVDVVVRVVLDVVCGPQKDQNGLGWAAGERNMIFYAGNGRIAGKDHKWVQDALTVTVAMFRRMGLDTNLYTWSARQGTYGGSGRSRRTKDERRSNAQGEEEVAGKLRIVRRDGGSIISQAAHGKPIWNMLPPDEGG